MCLKPAECVIIVECIALSDEILLAMKVWLRDSVPEFAEFVIAASGKYLGWFLGLDSVCTSYRDPFEKLGSRVHGITEGKALAATAVIRYNQRAAPVVSHVSQFGLLPAVAKLPELEQSSVHEILRMPPNSMSRKLCHTIPFCIEVDPVCLSAFCSTNLLRFAESESDYFLQLHSKVTDVRRVCPLADNTTLSSISAPAHGSNMLDVPSGGLFDPPHLVNLLNAIKLSGPLSCLNGCFCISRQESRYCDVCVFDSIDFYG